MRPPKFVASILLVFLAVCLWPGVYVVVGLTSIGLGFIQTDEDSPVPVRTLQVVTTALWLVLVVGYCLFMRHPRRR